MELSNCERVFGQPDHTAMPLVLVLVFATVRIIMFDFRKAFDLIDHRILTHKLRPLNLPVMVVSMCNQMATSEIRK